MNKRLSNERFLQHYGVLGMHWGRRRSSAPTIAIKKNTSEDHDTYQELKRKKVYEMSNSELKKFTERANLEKQYKDLTRKEVSRGRKIVEDMLSEIAKNAAKGYIKMQIDKRILKK